MSEAKERPLTMVISAACGVSIAAFFIYLHSGPETLAQLGWGSVPAGVAVMIASSVLGGWLGMLIRKLIRQHRKRIIRL
ncbi:hypothetical protein LLH00_05315 [bacterium]|nr:hypothetical protein [bacterium]